MEKILWNLRRQFDRAWISGATPSIQKYLNKAAQATGSRLSSREIKTFLVALIAIDVEQSWRRTAEDPETEITGPSLLTYVERFPQLGAVEELPNEILVAEFGALNRWGDTPSVDVYCQRLARLDTELRKELEQVALEMTKTRSGFPAIEGLRFIRKIDSGGFGTVYEARQLAEDRIVAVKMLRFREQSGSVAYGAFRREAQLVAKIQDPNVITLFVVGSDSSEPFLVMEYMAGGTLVTWSRRERKHRETNPRKKRSEWNKRSVRVMRAVAQGLAAAHGKDVVHRDLQPKNILFDLKGRPKIADFGLARLRSDSIRTETAGAGTVGYKSPEQALRRKEINLRSDIYSFGVVLFELLTGEMPFDGDKLNSVGRMDIAAPLARRIDRGVERDLETICEKCLQKDPAQRFQSADEIVMELSRFLKGEPILTRTPTHWERLYRSVSKPYRIIAGLTVAVLVTLTIAVVYQVQFRTAERERRMATAQHQTVLKSNKELSTEVELTKGQVDSSRKVIDAQQKTVQQKEALRRKAEKHAALIAYANDLQQIQRAWDQGHIKQASELLARHDPTEDGSGHDLRGFEWYYWNHLRQNAAAVLENGAGCRCLVSDRSGEMLAASDFQNVTVWNLNTHAKVWQRRLVPRKSNLLSHDLSHSWDCSVAFSPDGRLVAASGFHLGNPKRTGYVKVWETLSGEELLSIKDDASVSGRTVAFSPDGEFVVAGGYQNTWTAWNVTDKGTRLTSPNSSARQRGRGTLTPQRFSGAGSFDIVSFLGFSDDGTQLYSSCIGAKDSNSWSWETIASGSDRVFRPGGNIQSGIVRVRQNGSMWIARLASFNQKIHLLKHTRDRRLLGPPAFSRPRESASFRDITLSPPSQATCIDFQNRGHISHLIAGGSDHLVYAWVVSDGLDDVVGPEVLHGHEEDITCVGQLPNGRPVSADRSGVIRVWPQRNPEALDLETGNIVELTPGTPNDTIRVVRIRNNDGQLSEFPLREGELLSASLLSDRENYLALATYSHRRDVSPPRLILWDRAQGTQVLEYPCVGGGPGRWALSLDESTFAACVSPTQIKVWAIRSDDEPRSINVAKYSRMALSHAGRRLAARVGEAVAVWDLVTGERLCEIPAARQQGKVPAGFTFFSDGMKLAISTEPPEFFDVESGIRLDIPLEQVAEEEAVSQGIRRLYRVNDRSLDICCASTFRPLLSVPLRRSIGSEQPVAVREVAGANGFSASESIDRLLKELVAGWENPAVK
ncbi:Serine/threonine-protein kinase PrkC [Symmachiella dynata]|uniref:Serine/threonine-protein kinase PrkC n=1 Tax=Symmachiella dynata TaxID=2527995 RepID=A0A517ZRV1_9PLAN|nr:serine/threonine-protein kinase [Symmachiella dynata]QDU45197.1 Serine/threonine-protein kinase PrkC [Symmachiella dynata]